MSDSSRNRDYEQKQREIPKMEEEKQKLQSEIERARVKACASDEKMADYLETLKRIQNDLKVKAEKFAELRAKNKYTLKNIALNLQKSNKPHDNIESTLVNLDTVVEKTSFQALMQKDPFNLNQTYSANAADLFFFDCSSMPVALVYCRSRD